MSSSRILDPKFSWSEEQRAIELLDWETKPQDFDRLCTHVLDLLNEKGWTSQRIFDLLPEDQFRHEVHVVAQRFQERYVSLPRFISLWFRTSRLPQLASSHA